MAPQVYADRVSKRKKGRRESGTYMPGTIQHVVKLIPKVPTLISVLIKLDGEKRGSLRHRPRVPVSFERIVVHKGRVTAVLPILVVFRNFRQIPILVDIVRKNQHASLGRIAKAGWRCSWEFAQQHAGRVRAQFESFVGEMDRDGVDARRLGSLFGGDITNSAVVEPEHLYTVRYGKVKLDARQERRDEERLVISIRDQQNMQMLEIWGMSAPTSCL